MTRKLFEHISSMYEQVEKGELEIAMVKIKGDNIVITIQKLRDEERKK